jgi:hypothetical protein
MDVWLVELEWPGNHEVIGIALTRDLAKRMAEKDWTDRHQKQIDAWDWQDVDEESGFPRSYYDDYSIGRYQVTTA